MSELVVNPRARIRPVHVDGHLTAYAVSAPVKGRGRVERTVTLDGVSAAVTDVLRDLVKADDDVEVCDEACAALFELGILIEDREISQTVKFACHLAGSARPPPTALMVAPGVTTDTFDELAEREPDLAPACDPSEYVVQVADPTTDSMYPYALDRRDHDLVRQLVSGRLAPAELAGDDLERLVGAEILIDRQAVASARDRGRAATEQFAARGFAIIPRVFPPLQTAALRDYYRRLVEEGYATSQDSQVARRSGLHNERLMHYYHRQLCGFFAQVVQAPIKPSYTYFASYRRGATLEPHRDRDQCKYTVSVLLDYVTLPGDDPVWPLYVELPADGELVTVELSPGDGVLFCGQAQTHHRPELRAETSMSLLFHFVDESYSGSLS